MRRSPSSPITRSTVLRVGCAATRCATWPRSRVRPSRNEAVPPRVAPSSTRALPLATPKTAPAAMVMRNAGSMRSTTPTYEATNTTGAQTPSVCIHADRPGRYGDANWPTAMPNTSGTAMPAARPRRWARR